MRRHDRFKVIENLNKRLNSKKNSLVENAFPDEFKGMYDDHIEPEDDMGPSPEDLGSWIEHQNRQETEDGIRKGMGEDEFIDVDSDEFAYPHGVNQDDEDIERRQDYDRKFPDGGYSNMRYENKKPKTLKVLNEASKTMFDKLCGVVLKEGYERHQYSDQEIANMSEDQFKSIIADAERVIEIDYEKNRYNSKNRQVRPAEDLIVTHLGDKKVGFQVDVDFSGQLGGFDVRVEMIVDNIKGHLGSPATGNAPWDAGDDPEYDYDIANAKISVINWVVGSDDAEVRYTLSTSESIGLIHNSNGFGQFMSELIEEDIFAIIANGYEEPDWGDLVSRGYSGTKRGSDISKQWDHVKQFSKGNR